MLDATTGKQPWNLGLQKTADLVRKEFGPELTAAQFDTWWEKMERAVIFPDGVTRDTVKQTLDLRA